MFRGGWWFEGVGCWPVSLCVPPADLIIDEAIDDNPVSLEVRFDKLGGKLAYRTCHLILFWGKRENLGIHTKIIYVSILK